MSIRIPTDEETSRFASAVSAHLTKVTIAYIKQNRPLVPPSDIRRAMGHINMMRHRHRRGEFTHTTEEARALAAVAEWLVKKWHDLHGTEAPPREAYYHGG